ncbi:MAG: fatty acid/phospholipid synthesis protein PlsX [Oscillospiraceae bacterium]
MELSVFFKSIVDSDEAPVVVCSLDHTIIYMNPSAVKRYEKRGGAALVGKSLLECHNADSNGKIQKIVDWFGKSLNNNKVFTFYNEKENKDVYMVALRSDDGTLIGYYEKHEYRSRETGSLYDLK